MTTRILALPALALLLTGCTATTGKPSATDAAKFLDSAETRLLAASNEAGRASWVYSTHITEDTEAISALANERQIGLAVELAKEAATYDGVTLPPDQARKMKLLKLSLSLAAPADAKLREETTKLAAAMEGAYGKFKVCPEGVTPPNEKCIAESQISRIMAESRDPKELLRVWTGWHNNAPPMRKDYARFVELANQGAKELGFADSGAMWRSKYDMPPDEFAKELDRLWAQVKPLYDSLHTYARKRLRAKYGDAVPATGPIPAHLLGNLWSQSWDNVYPLLAPAGSDMGYDLTQILKAKKYDEREMARAGERFFTSLGFEKLPPTFWERSMFAKPRDREVVCHASAWDVDNVNDLRIKMCIQITGEEFAVVHHELGHNFYQRAYNSQPFLFRDSANDGFHEAIGDTIALSITPEYLGKLGFLAKPTDPSKDTGLLLHRALEKVAFLPFGLLVDQWRWKVFSGEVKPENYNTAWWELKKKYQGVVPATARAEEFFDPGAKYHVPGNVPYTRYFLAHILQFQFHRALAKAAGCTQQLHRCSIYESKEAGAKLQQMLALGASKPWPEALKAMTGEDKIDATAILDYFAPLKQWLDEQNKGETVGW
ncbi:MAG: M2 family metallopeptidase [Acidobacteria bacterium]|nr:M2 family metallopeptidase [Acidobacteriota bacterium]